MNWFTVEVTLTGVSDDDWTRHLRAVDAVPGSYLVQDPEAPVLSFPVECGEPFAAARFVEGVLSITGLEAVSGEISDLPEIDFEIEDDAADEPVVAMDNEVVRRVHDWMGETPAAPRELVG